MTRSRPSLLVGIAILVALFGMATTPSVAADVSGTTYTSPQHGYTVTWEQPWFFLEEASEATLDTLILSDGNASANFFADIPLFGDASLLLNALIQTVSGFEGVTNFQPLSDANGSPLTERSSDAAHAFYQYTMTYPDSSVAEELVYLEGRMLSQNVEVAIIGYALTVDAVYYIDAFPALTSGLTMPGTSATIGDNASIDGAGEPAPVFAAQPWRIAAAGTAIGNALPEFQLEPKVGRDWWVVIVDVTNWTAVDATFSLRELLIQTGEMPEPVDLAPSSTTRVAELTGLQPAAGTDLSVAAGATARTVLVYSIAAGGTNAMLHFGIESLPIQESISLTLAPAAMPAAAAPPAYVSGTVTAISGEEVTIDVAGVATPVHLLGVTIPSPGECYGVESLAAVSSYVGSSVLIESDSQLTTNAGSYLWTENLDGSKSMINHALLRDGLAKHDALPEGSRFGAWLEQSGSNAEEASNGLWAACSV